MNKKVFSKIISLILLQTLTIPAAGVLAAEQTDCCFTQSSLTTMLSPQLNLSLPDIQHIFLNEGNVRETNQLLFLLKFWSAENKKIIGGLRLEEIKDRAYEDLMILDKQIAVLDEKIEQLLSACQKNPTKRNYESLIEFFVENKSFFYSFDSNIQLLLNKNQHLLGAFPEKLQELRKHVYTRVDTKELFTFLLEHILKDDIQGGVLNAAREQKERLKKEHRRKKDKVMELLGTLDELKNKNTQRWQANDLTLVDELMRKLKWEIEQYIHDYQCNFSKWILDARPDLEGFFKKTSALLNGMEGLDKENAVRLLGELERAILLLNSYQLFFETEEQALLKKEKVQLIKAVLQKSKVIAKGKDVALFHIDKKTIDEIGGTSHDIKHYINEAKKENKDVILLGNFRDLSNLVFWQGDYSEEDLMQMKIIFADGKFFLADDFSGDLTAFLNNSMAKFGNLQLLNLHIVFWLEALIKDGIKLPVSHSKVKAEHELLKADFIYDILLQAYQQYKLFREADDEGEYQIRVWNYEEFFHIFPLLNKELHKEVLSLVYKNEDGDFRDFVSKYLERIKYSGLVDNALFSNFKKGVFELALSEQDVLLKKRMVDDLLRLWRSDKDFFYLAARTYDRLNSNEKSNLIDFLLKLDLSAFETPDMLNMLAIIEKDPNRLKDVFAYLLAFLELEDKSAVDGDLPNIFLRDLLNADINLTYNAVRYLIEILPKTERTGYHSRGEAVDNLVMLDDLESYPDERRKTVFSDLRRIVHSNINKDFTELFYRLLLYWKDLNPEVLNESSDRNVIGYMKYNFADYHKALNILYQSLKDTVPKFLPDRDLDHFDIFLLTVEKGRLLNVVKDSGAEPLDPLTKTAWTIITYQAMARKFGASVAGLNQKMADTKLSDFPKIEKMRIKFIERIDGNSSDKLKNYRYYTKLRQKINTIINKEFKSKRQTSADFERRTRLVGLLQYDLLLERFGQVFFGDIFERINEVKNLKSLKQSAKLLALVLKNFIYSGFGNTAIEELIKGWKKENYIYHRC